MTQFTLSYSTVKPLVLAIISLTISACASNSSNDNQKSLDSLNKTTSGANTTNTANNTSDVNTITPQTAVKLVDASTAVNIINTPQPNVLYFDFDSYTMRNSDMPTLQKHQQFLQSQSNAKQNLIVQGHTDNRGSSEYNVALGQKRGESVKRSLNLLGANVANIEVVSFGKEKPASNGQSEADHQLNRRAELIYPK